MAKPKALTIKELENDKAGFEQLIAQQRQVLVNTEAAILRLEGAHVYVSNNLKRLQQKEQPPEEVKDAPTS